jgi:hypothetical protein
LSEQMTIFARKGFESKWNECGDGNHNIRLGGPRVCIPDPQET